MGYTTEPSEGMSIGIVEKQRSDCHDWRLSCRVAGETALKLWLNGWMKTQVITMLLFLFKQDKAQRNTLPFPVRFNLIG